MGRKRSRLKLYVAVVLVVVIVLALVVFLVIQPSQGRAPGVKVGDEFIYDITGTYSPDSANASVPENFYQLNMTEWYKITVTNVNTSQVAVDTVWHFTNGTELNQASTVNIETGTTYPSNGFWAIFAANLKENDVLRPSGMEQNTINETKTTDYGAGVARETNVVTQVRQYTDQDDPTGSTTMNEIVTIQFDKQTGMLVRLADVSIYNNPQITLNISWKLKESNVWTVS
jgi:hypothetical protein